MSHGSLRDAYLVCDVCRRIVDVDSAMVVWDANDANDRMALTCQGGRCAARVDRLFYSMNLAWLADPATALWRIEGMLRDYKMGQANALKLVGIAAALASDATSAQRRGARRIARELDL